MNQQLNNLTKTVNLTSIFILQKLILRLVAQMVEPIGDGVFATIEQDGTYTSYEHFTKEWRLRVVSAGWYMRLLLWMAIAGIDH